MSPDFGNFFSQIFGVLAVYLIIPVSILLIWFTMLRPYLKKRNKQKDGDAQPVMATYNPANIDTPLKINTDMLPDLDTILRSEEISAPPIRRDGIIEVTLNTGQPVQAREIMIVLRDERDGRMMVQLDDVAYRSLKGTGDAKKSFTHIMKDLSSTILQDDVDADMSADTTDSFDAEEQPSATQVVEDIPTITPDEVIDNEPSLKDLMADQASKPATPNEPAPTPQPIQETPVKRTTTELPTLADGTLPGDLPSYKFDDNPAKIEKKRGGRVKVEFVPPPDLDIPSAIEAYLQYKIHHTPEFQNRNIHVVPAIDGGVRIRVGEIYFEGVADVDDVVVREFLQETIAEWQDRQ